MKVSVWIGTAPSWEVLDGHLTFRYTEDGDAIPCRFCDAFGFDWFDDDFREASHSEKATTDIGELLKRHSHGVEIGKAINQKTSAFAPSNAVVLLYEFEYSGDVRSASVGEGTILDYIGCVEI